MVQRPESDPEQPDVNSVWALCPQPVRRGNNVVADSPTAALNIDSHDLSMVVRFDLAANDPLIYLVAETGRLLAWAARTRHDSVGLCWNGTL